MKIFSIIGLFVSVLLSESYFYEYNKRVNLVDLNQSEIINDKVIKYYQTSNGKRIGINDKIILKCINASTCNATLSKYSLKEINFINSTLLVATIFEGDDVFQISRILYEDDNIEFSKPNILQKVQRR